MVNDRYFRLILDEATDGILVEAREKIVYVNAAYAAILGYHSPGDLIGRAIQEIVSEEDSDRLLWFGRLRERGQPAPRRYNFRGRRRDATAVTFDASVSTAKASDQLFITTVVREMSSAEDRVPLVAIPGLRSLSSREYAVVKYLVAGRRAKEIALTLQISEKTVATYRHRVYQKLALRNELDLFRFAVQHGLLDPLV